MSNKTLLAILFATTFVLAGCQNESETEPVVETDPTPTLDNYEDQISYLLGFGSGAQIVDNGIEVNTDAYQLGVADALGEIESRLDDAQTDIAFQQFQAEMQARVDAQQAEIEAEMQALAAENAAKSEAFLAENATKEGVVTLESGLQYKVVIEGDGPTPSETSTVRVNYEGRSIEGVVFDSSFDRGTPVEFGLQQVIAGWTEGLQLMPEGSTYELYIPSDLAYREAGSPGAIGPNEALIFVVELISADVGDE